MRRNQNPQPAELRPMYSPGEQWVAGILCAAVIVVAIVAASYPVATAWTVFGALGTVGAHRVLVAVRAFKARRIAGRTRQVCLPNTEVCIEA